MKKAILYIETIFALAIFLAIIIYTTTWIGNVYSRFYEEYDSLLSFTKLLTASSYVYLKLGSIKDILSVFHNLENVSFYEMNLKEIPLVCITSKVPILDSSPITCINCIKIYKNESNFVIQQVSESPRLRSVVIIYTISNRPLDVIYSNNTLYTKTQYSYATVSKYLEYKELEIQFSGNGTISLGPLTEGTIIIIKDIDTPLKKYLSNEFLLYCTQDPRLVPYKEEITVFSNIRNFIGDSWLTKLSIYI